ncbi:MAG: DUF1902 domain-containing protein [Hyphomicrobiales bacterium]
MANKLPRDFIIKASWDADAGVWLASSDAVPGLAVEAETWPRLLDEIGHVLPDLIELNRLELDASAFTVRAESRVSLSAA